MGDLAFSLFLSLLITELLECAAALALGKRGKALVLCGLANLATNPAVVLLHFLLGGGWAVIALLEGAAVLAEGGFYRYSGLYSRPFLFSLASNCLSFFSGLLITHFIRFGGIV